MGYRRRSISTSRIICDAGAGSIHADHIILATGAMERPMPFPGWTLPGVMGVGAAQTLLKSSGLLPEGRVVLAGTGPLVYLFARQMLAAGGRPAAILDTAGSRPAAAQWPALFRALLADSGAMRKGMGWIREIRRAGISHVHGVRRIAAEGQGKVESVSWEDAAGGTHRLACDLLPGA